ncbi:GIY-YIG nuclease family protein [Abyssalbus ytuae]|uniref:GIY-YIG nuclease family protein n=1 Tax=Abyssalbus ytuae TaxID=2926907 RepID=A0A9E7D2F5_9FLAO|nr:GIY-YIG nuclease family protein [Abyssalbus ytuae]UOB18113.1 GIY-YIG nuclease family protein [Abyssalbus ytuae]
MKYVVYIIYSEQLDGYYVGQTYDLDDRLKRHNSGRSGYTKKGIPWKLVKTILCNSRPEAVKLEKKIKNRGIKRFLEDINIGM